MKKLLFTILMTCGIICMLGFTNPELTKMLQEKTQRIMSLTVENLNLKTKIINLETDLKAVKNENRVARKANTIIQFFRDAGYNDPSNPFARDPKHIQQVYLYGLKYKELLTEEAREICRKGNVIPEEFLMCWISEQTHFNPLVECYNKDKSGRIISIDRNITQINSGARYDKKLDMWFMTNEAWDHGYSKLPLELRKKRCNPYNDVEIGVAMFFVWINSRVEDKKAFAYATWSWKLYIALKEVDNGKQELSGRP